MKQEGLSGIGLKNILEPLTHLQPQQHYGPFCLIGQFLHSRQGAPGHHQNHQGGHIHQG